MSVRRFKEASYMDPREWEPRIGSDALQHISKCRRASLAYLTWLYPAAFLAIGLSFFPWTRYAGYLLGGICIAAGIFLGSVRAVNIRKGINLVVAQLGDGKPRKPYLTLRCFSSVEAFDDWAARRRASESGSTRD
ncbi:hypothetical protein [Nostocoides japonicum]|nr:hypothetical protein [Tetrasphaera japonica]